MITDSRKSKTMKKPYQSVPIKDCCEPLLPIPLDVFAIEIPHPYEKLGANYRGKSPYYLRQSVIEALITAHDNLQQRKPNWRINIFDGFRPLWIQQFMVDYTFNHLIQSRTLVINHLSPSEIEVLWQEVYTIWAVPSDDPKIPPPHSTGAAVDLTLMDETGKLVEMGGEIDELSLRSHPDYYLNALTPTERQYHENRELLSQIMQKAGFRRHPGEWWHFSCGDQMWVWLGWQNQDQSVQVARYGRIE